MMRRFMRKVGKSLIWVVLAIGTFVITLSFLSAHVSSGQVHDFYFFLFPHAGIVSYEAEYKKNYELAESLLAKENQLQDDIKYNTSSVEEFERKHDAVADVMSDRNAAFVEMLRIDTEVKRLRLPENYKMFYTKRIAADTTDYKAFRVYRDGDSELLDAILAMMKFSYAYNDADNAFLELISSNMAEDADARFYYRSALLDDQYQNMVGYTSTHDIFTKDVLAFLQRDYTTIQLFRKMESAIKDNDVAMEQQLTGDFLAQANDHLPDFTSIVTEWNIAKIQPILTKQDVMHKSANDLYKIAYLYAKNEKLSAIHPLKDFSQEPPKSSSGSI